MNTAWNLWDTKPPPVCSVKTILHLKEITDLNEVTFNALKTVKNLNFLDREAAILSRILYKNKRVFRHDKGMQYLVKVNQCLKRYLKLNMSGVLFKFKQTLSFKYNPAATHAYLPTKQMLMWVLINLQAFSQIFVRLINLSKEVGAYFFRKLCLGWTLNFSLLVLSITARILGTSRYLVKKSIEWYNTLYRYLPFLQQTTDFLPNYNLPTNLKLWLGPVDLATLQKKSFVDEIFEFIDLTKGDEEENDEMELKVVHQNFMKAFFKKIISKIDSDVEEVIEEEIQEKKTVKKPVKVSQNEDLGVSIVEEVLKTPRTKERSKDGKRFKCPRKVKKRVKNSAKHVVTKNYAESSLEKFSNSVITID